MALKNGHIAAVTNEMHVEEKVSISKTETNFLVADKSVAGHGGRLAETGKDAVEIPVYGKPGADGFKDQVDPTVAKMRGNTQGCVSADVKENPKKINNNTNHQFMKRTGKEFGWTEKIDFDESEVEEEEAVTADED